MRRPLRFLAHKLSLNEAQVAELAQVIEALKLERAQAEVDEQRVTAAFADALAGDAIDAGRLSQGAALRGESEARVRAAVLRALSEMHRIFNADQREKLAHLLRTGAVVL